MMKNKVILSLFFILFLLSSTLAEIPIYCPYCKTHLYNYQFDEIKKGFPIYAKDFLPANDLIIQPTENTRMICPLDQTPLNGWEYWGKLQNFKSFHFMYDAVSLLTKDKDGKWLWMPYDIPELNMNEKE